MHLLAQQIVAKVAEENGFTFEDMVTEGRRLRIVSYARFEAMARIRDLKQPNGKAMFSLILIGRWFGTDHTTVHHATQRYEEAVAILAKYREANPVGEIPPGALKREGIERGLATYVKALAVREEREREQPEPEMTPDEKYVAAILADRPSGFEARREVYLRQARDGVRYITIPRTYYPMTDPDDFTWAQALARAA